MNSNMCIVGTIEAYCNEKADKAWDEGTKLGKAKACAWSFLSGVPAGLFGCGLMLYGLGIAAKLCGGKKIEIDFIDKD